MNGYKIVLLKAILCFIGCRKVNGYAPEYVRNYFSNIFNPYLNSPQYSSKQVQKNIINTTFSESLSNFIVFINKKAPEFPRPNP